MRVAPAVIASLALLNAGFSPQGQVHAQPPHAVDVHIEALGGAEALAKVKTLQRSGTAKTSGAMGDAEGTFEEAFDFASELGATTLDLGVFVQDSGWHGDSGWQQNSFEGLKVMQQSDLDFAQLTARPSVLAHLRSLYGIAAFAEPEEVAIDGRAMLVLNVINSPLQFYLDKETQMLQRMQIPGILEVTYGDYREVDGVKMPFEVEVDITVAGLNIVYVHEETAINGTIEPQTFERPAGI